MKKKYIVRLTDAERVTLEGVVKRLKGSSARVRRAQVLLKADADGPGGRMPRSPRRTGAVGRRWRTSANGS